MVKKIFILSIILAGLSVESAEFFYGQTAYGPIFMFLCLIFYASIKFLQKMREGNKKQYLLFGVLLSLVLMIVFISNPKRAFVTYLIPIISTVGLPPEK